MFFFLENLFTSHTPALHLYERGLPDLLPSDILHVQPGRQQWIRLELPAAGQLLLLGDPVSRPTDIAATTWLDPLGNLDVQQLYRNIRGHYTWFHLHNQHIACGNSFGALFPLYYQVQHDRVRICSSAFFLAQRTNNLVPDRRYLLERLLFNYPLGERTPFKGIQLLDAHSRLRISQEGVQTEKAFFIEQHFRDGREKSRAALDRTAEFFEEESRLFLPDEPFAVSFTGGFDGRTLLAAARNAGRTDFFAYSFGMPGESDVLFPSEQAGILKIPYQPIYLDDSYVQVHALDAAWAFLRLSGYNGNFGRPHYHYAAQRLSEKTAYLLTGNFGSELFRALHQPGVMMSEALIQLFSSTKGAWKDYFPLALGEKAASFFREEIDELIADLEVYLHGKQALSSNERFYVFVFEELFRKYFGPELVMQSHYLRNRTPYLSLPFFQALNDTIWSGVHARLFEKQKTRRLKGQIFYAAFLKRTDAQLYRLPTNKGYTPADVLESWRRPILLGKVLHHKIFRQETGDSNAVEAWFSRFQDTLVKQIQAAEFPELQHAGIADLLGKKRLPDLESSIHYFSLAAAWAAASRITNVCTANTTE